MRHGALSDKTVISNCPIYQPVPMMYIDKVLNPKHEPAEAFEGIKRIHRDVPARPINMNALAVALANLSLLF